MADENREYRLKTDPLTANEIARSHELARELGWPVDHDPASVIGEPQK